MPRPTPQERFIKFVQVPGYGTGCWLWRGKRTKDPGGDYGRFWVEGKEVSAHRWAYENILGVCILPEYVLDHVACDNPPCVNPFHMKLSTNRANVLRGNGPSAINARKTFCACGQPYTPYFTKAGRYYHRRCESCSKVKARRQRRLRSDNPSAVVPRVLSTFKAVDQFPLN